MESRKGRECCAWTVVRELYERIGRKRCCMLAPQRKAIFGDELSAFRSLGSPMLRFGWKQYSAMSGIKGVQVMLMTYVSESNARGFGDVAWLR